MELNSKVVKDISQRCIQKGGGGGGEGSATPWITEIYAFIRRKILDYSSYIGF